MATNAPGAGITQPLLASGDRGQDYGSSSSKAQETRRPDASLVAVVHFSPGDPEDPRNWPRWKKWLMIGPILLIDLSVSWGASGFSPATKKFADEFGLSPEAGTLGLSLYVLGLAFGPMTLAPLSEYYGRRPIYIYAYFIFLVCLAASALVPSLAVFIPIRLLSGYFSSVTIANFGGTIADLYHPHDTGPAMSLYLWAATCGSPTGFFLMSFVAQTRGWRDVFWALLGICGSLWAIMTASLLFCGETRHSIILARRVERARKLNNTSNIDVPDNLKKRGVKELFALTLARPFRFLASEAIIMFAALYNGYLYGLSFLFNTAFALVFGQGHGFDTIGVGISFLGICAGISLGPITNIWQERYYQRKVHESGGKNVPEARVQMGKIAAIAFPISLTWFALTTSSSIHPSIPILASALWGWSFYTLILMTFTYTEDSYKVYSASALAGIGLVRNLFGAAFPLFAHGLFTRLGFRWAGLLLAALALVLVPIPFVWSRYGRVLRERSPWAREHMDDLDGEEGEEGPHDEEEEARGGRCLAGREGENGGRVNGRD
ncbi:Sugar transporter conserved site [Macrophomina phaseolina MS6]|uniref:Sugar transporter conserved site n=2 Tax=Macrophomina phaseolina TaxID=35725 RepID=K2RR08_MACPH|nr:Sugar transporter conserved site [Macrophomina phaseolina MS6]